MTTPTNWRASDRAEDWFRQQEKRTAHEARRPTITRASDLLGPGFAPTAVEVRDWNAPETQFNGFFYSDVGALNTPDPDVFWTGQSVVTPTGRGTHVVWSNFDDLSLGISKYVRAFRTHATGMTTYSAWNAF